MERGKIIRKIENLLRLASNNPSKEEARAAMLKAQELMLKYHIDNPETAEDEKVASVHYDLAGRRKTEYVLLLSVVVAENFRCKTLHYANNIYFLGFTEDALAAKEVYRYILKYGDDAYEEYFLHTPATRRADIDWKYGYVVGLKKAFDSRTGYELMKAVPHKVIETLESLKRHPFIPESDCRVSGLDGAFADGFKNGKESIENRSLETFV